MSTLTYRNNDNQKVIFNQFPEFKKLVNNLNKHIVSRRNNLEWLIFKEPEYGEFYNQMRKTEFVDLAQAFPDESYKILAISKDDNKVHLMSVFMQEYIQLNHSQDKGFTQIRYYEPFQFDSYLLGLGAWDLTLMTKSKTTKIKGLGVLLISLAKRYINVFTISPLFLRLYEIVKELGFTEIPIYKPDLQTKLARVNAIPTMINNADVLARFTKAPMSRGIRLGDRMPPPLKNKILDDGNIPAIIKSFKVNEQLLLKLPKGLRLEDELYVAFTPEGKVELHLENKLFNFPVNLISNIVHTTSGLLRICGGYENKLIELYELEKYGFRKFYNEDSLDNLLKEKHGVEVSDKANQPLTRQQKRRLERDESKKVKK